jgi:hypothetical protein
MSLSREIEDFKRNFNYGQRIGASGGQAVFQWYKEIQWTILIRYTNAIIVRGANFVLTKATASVNNMVTTFEESIQVPFVGRALHCFGRTITLNFDSAVAAALELLAMPETILKDVPSNQWIANPAVTPTIDIPLYANAYRIAPYINNSIQRFSGATSIVTINDANLDSSKWIPLHPEARILEVPGAAVADTVISWNRY